MEEENPSVRFYCSSKETLDDILKHVDKARKYASKVLGITLDMYIAYREKAGCQGCKIGSDKCVHWSPEKVEVNRS
jgi:hypothetical protein